MEMMLFKTCWQGQSTSRNAKWGSLLKDLLFCKANMADESRTSTGDTSREHKQLWPLINNYDNHLFTIKLLIKTLRGFWWVFWGRGGGRGINVIYLPGNICFPKIKHAQSFRSNVHYFTPSVNFTRTILQPQTPC